MANADPPSVSRIRAGARKIVTVDYDLCHSCGACVAICPADALFLNDAHLEVNAACTVCERCVKICPVHALSVAERNSP